MIGCFAFLGRINLLVQPLISSNYRSYCPFFLYISHENILAASRDCISSGRDRRRTIVAAKFSRCKVSRREKTPARIPLALMYHDVHRARGAGYTNVCTMPSSQEPRKKLQLSPLPSHMVATLPPPRCAEMRCDVLSSPFSPPFSPPTLLLMHSPALIREDGSHRGHSVPIARVKT